MYRFNLLPAIHQRQTRWWLMQTQLGYTLTIMNIFIFILVIIFFQFNNLVTQMTIDAQEQYEQVVHVAQGSNRKTDIHELNTQIQMMKTVQDQHTNYPAVLATVLQITPEKDIVLNTLQINTEERLISITGVAQNRDALEQLRINTEQEPTLGILEFPFGAFAQSEKIPFSIMLEELTPIE